MNRRSDFSDSTAQGRTAITGQLGKLPREGIISENSRGAHGGRQGFETRQFSTEQIRQRERHTAQHTRTDMSSTRQIPVTRGTSQMQNRSRPAGPNPAGMQTRQIPAQGRTGSAPYLYGNAQGRSAQSRPVQRRKRKPDPLYIRILRWCYFNRRAAAAVLCLFLVVTIAVPLAVYAASGSNDSQGLFRDAGDKGEIIDTIDKGTSDDSDGPDSTVKDDSTSPDSGNAPSVIPPKDTEEDTSGKDTEPEESVSPDESDTEEVTESESEDEPEETEPVEDELDENKFTVTIGFYDREAIVCYTEANTLRNILAEAGYVLRDTDRPTVSLDEMIEYQSWIMIDSVVTKTVTESEAIPFEVETHESQSVPRGTTRTVSKGVYGQKDKVYTVEYVNGVETSRSFEYEYVASYPTNQIDYYGIGGTFYAPDGTMYSYSYKLDVRATYYNIHGTTATGLPTGDNVMAVDPSVIPLGSSVYVMNDTYDMGIRIAADTGGAVKGNIIDLWMSDGSPYYIEFAHQGVHSMVAYVLD